MTEFVRRFCVGCQETFDSTYDCTVHGITCEPHLRMFEGSVYEKKVRAMMEKHKNAEIVARTCLGCEKTCNDQPSFYNHWKKCEKAKSIIKKPRGMVKTENGTVLKTLQTCRGCKQTFPSRNELHRHYCTCLKNLELFKGTDYYNQQKTFLERMNYEPKKAETTCPGCYSVFSSHGNLSAHRFHCTTWIQVSDAKEIKEKSAKEILQEIKTSYEPQIQPLEKPSFVSLAKEKSKGRIKTILDPKQVSDADFYVGLIKPAPTPAPVKPMMVSAETQTEKPSCIKFGQDQIKEIPNNESEEYMLEKEAIESLSYNEPQSNNNPPTIPIQIQGLWVRMNNQVYYVPPQAVHAVAYVATPAPMPLPSM